MKKYQSFLILGLKKFSHTLIKYCLGIKYTHMIIDIVMTINLLLKLCWFAEMIYKLG